MIEADAIIIGGGPAGSTCAWKLQQAGMEVVVVDKSTFPRDKVCAGWITPAVVEELQLDLEDYARGRTLQALEGFRVSMLGEKETETHYGKTVSYGIRRCEFDHYLLDRVTATRITEAVKDIRRQDQHWVINQHVRAPLLIGAGGHFCPVARHLGAKPGSSEPAVAAKEIEFEMNPEQAQHCTIREEVPELFFCRDLKGYGWVFRKDNFLNIGLGRQDTRKLSQHIEEFVDYLKQLGKIPRDIPERLHGHAYLLYGDAPRKVLDDGVLLIGDAAGLAYAQSGEGIRPAIESALMAAHTILHAGGNYSADRLQPYLDQLNQRFGQRDRRQTLAVGKLMPESLTRFLASKLLSNAWFARHLVLNRWFFHLHQKPLAG